MWVLSLGNAVLFFLFFLIWKQSDWANTCIKATLFFGFLLNLVACFYQYGYIVKLGG